MEVLIAFTLVFMFAVVVAPIWMLWRYLHWVKTRRQHYLQFGNRNRNNQGKPL